MNKRTIKEEIECHTDVVTVATVTAALVPAMVVASL